jgi:Polyketide cyclase / dehydrase and lipid transport
MERPRIVGEATITIAAPPEHVFAFILDLNRYRQADRKIGRVGEVRRSGRTGTMRFSGRMRGVPGPSGTYPFRISDSRIEIGTPTDGPVRWFIREFEGTFEIRKTDSGTVITHREAFSLKPPWDWVADRLLRNWLENDVKGEVARLKALLEAEQAVERGA